MTFLYAFLTSIVLSLTVQSEIPYTSIEKAFISNDAGDIVALGKDKMLINVLGKEGAYSQSQANLVLKDFFIKKPGSTFKFIFKGKESADGSFAIGTYESRGESFRVTIHFKKIGADFKIESLIIEKS
jgi:putative sterol carrier protein